MQNLLKIITGGTPLFDFASLVFFAIIGIGLSLLMQSTNRDVSTLSTPYYFSWKFLWSDNTKRILASIILVYVFLRFLPELTGLSITEFYALVIGFLNDKLAQLLKNKTNILDTKKSN